MLLHLRDGRVQWGRSIPGPEGFVFARLDNGGIARLSWGCSTRPSSAISSSSSATSDLTGDEYMIDADRIVTTDGPEFTGILIDRRPMRSS